MVNIEKISETAMEIITYSGCAKSSYMEALYLAKQGKFAECDQKLAEGDEHFVQAHHGHGGLLQVEMETEEPQISLLMTHAEDQLMGAEMLKLVIQELIELYKSKEEK